MSRWNAVRRFRLEIRGGFGLALGAVMLLAGPVGSAGEPTSAADSGIRPAQTTPLDRGPVELSEFLCCGQTAGGTRIWGIDYPRGWQVVLLPNNPAEFFGALFIDPQSSVMVAYVPAATTVPGAVTDVGNVDLFLNGLVTERRQEFRGFTEVHRGPLPGIPNGRLWVGTWPGQEEAMWEALIAVVNPSNLEYLLPGMPRGNLTMMGVRASSSQWAWGQNIYERMVASTRVRLLDGGFRSVGLGSGQAQRGAWNGPVLSATLRLDLGRCRPARMGVSEGRHSDRAVQNGLPMKGLWPPLSLVDSIGIVDRPLPSRAGVMSWQNRRTAAP